MTTQLGSAKGRIIRNAAGIGSFASQETSKNQTGRVVGITSAGVFIKFNSSRMLFLSEGKRHGPITIQLPAPCLELRQVRGGELVQTGEGNLVFQDTGLTVQTAGLESWQPVVPDLTKKGNTPQQWERLAQLSAGLLAVKPDKGFSPLLYSIINDFRQATPIEIGEDLLNRVDEIRTGLKEKDPARAAEAAGKILGYGPGLTPSGDDFVLGMLLVINRWHTPEWESARLAELNLQVIFLAQEKTTALSANLIECATAGDADEFLILTADYLLADQGSEQACLDGLLRWGSNSGVDTLAGMALAILS